MPQDVNVIGGARDLATGINGAYFTASNPTPGTGIVGHAAPTTFDDTKPYLYVFNAGQKTIYPMYLRLTVTVVPTGTTSMRFTQALEPPNATAATKYVSGGTVLASVNSNVQSNNPSSAQIAAGAVVASAKSATRRVVCNQTYRTVIGVVGDVYQLCWATHDQIDPASLITTGTAVANVAFGYPPVAIGPNSSFLVHQWASGQSVGPTFEIEFAYCEF